MIDLWGFYMSICFKKICPLFIFLLFMIIIIPQAFASDINDTEIISDDVGVNKLVESVEVNDEQVDNVNDKEAIENVADEETLSSPDGDENESSVISSNVDEIYVSENGNDKNNGSYSAPFATIYRAVNVAKDTGVSDICILEGYYKESGIDIDTSVNIRGMGNVIIDAEKKDRIFKIEGEYEVEMSGLTLINGYAPTDAVTEDIHEIVYHADGGAIDILEAYVTLINMTFINNTAEDFGGAINVEGRYCYIKNSRFYSNYAGVFGGAIDIEADNATVDNCIFIANEASNGAAIGCIANACNFTNSIFENNSASDTGGAIFIENGDLSWEGTNAHLIENNKFINNEAVQQGGAIEVENQQMTSSADWTLIQKNEFINNSAYNGGAISAYYGDAGIKNNLFINNTAGYGGAIAAISTTDSPYVIIGGLYLKNNTIINCTAEENGNAIFNMGYYGTALNITFIEGKTVYSNDGKAVILNVTVFDDVGNPISGSPLDFTVGGKATINPASDLIEGVGSVRFVPRENGTFIVSGIYGSEYNMEHLYNVVTGKIVVDNAVPDYFGTIYVSAAEGDDDNTGAEGSPVKTFNQAFVLATRTGGSFDIVIYEGTYSAYGYYLEQSFNVTGIGNPILDAKNQGNVFSLNGQINDEFHITGITFKNGVASTSKHAGMYEGGLIFFKGGKLYLENDTFMSSSAKDYGGAVHINKGFDYNGGGSYAAFAYINNCTFKNNLADYFGGAISLYDCDVVVTNSNFISNKAKKGGAISILNGMGNLTVINSSFENNFASDMGGALEIEALNTYNTRYFANIYNSTFKSNTANYGGAIVAGDADIDYCTFIKNIANNYGGAIFGNETFLGEAIINQTIVKNCIFDSNVAEKGLDYFGTSILVNNNFWGNNFKSLSELINSDKIYFIPTNKELSWVNLEIVGLEDIEIGQYQYQIRFVSNDGSNLTDYLPEYTVKLSNVIVNNTLDVNEAIISNNVAVLNYNASEISNDVLSVLNINDNVLIANKLINIINQTQPAGNDSTNSSDVQDNSSTKPDGKSPVTFTKKATKLTVPNKKFLVTSKSKKVTVRLTDASGKALSNKKITYSINGITKTVKTNSKGQAVIKLSLKVKTYKLTVKFTGDGLYKGTAKTAKIKVIKEKTKLKVPKKTYKKSSKSKKIIITLKSASGKAISKKKVTFKLNGKKYAAKTNKKGKAVVKVKLTTKKTYKFKVKFAGDNKYRAIAKKSSIKIK